MVRYSHLLKNFPHFIGIHTVKGFGIVNKPEIDVFLELACLFHDPVDVEQFDLWFLCLFESQLEHQEIHSSRIAKAWLGEF